MGSVIQIIDFQIGSEYFGMEINRIRKIVEKTEKIKISNMHSMNITGMLNLQDDTIPILNLHEKLHIEPLPGNTYFVVINVNKKLAVFPIDKVGNCYNVSVQCLNLVPSLVRNAREQYFHQIADLDGKLVLILNPELLLNGEDRYELFGD